MKAAQIESYGKSSNIQLNEVDTPTISPNQVLVEVYASSLNPFDTMVREGYVKETIPLELPITLAGDIAGIVSEVGSEVKNIAVGDKVYGQASMAGGNSGALAEFAATSSEQIAIIPGNLNYIQAASLPLVGVSALQALSQHIGLQSGQKIFIHGGNGAIGAIAIMVAKSIGAYVATTATGEGVQFVKSLGADEVVDYQTQDFTEVLSEYDAVFDTVGGDDFNNSFAILKPGSTAVSMVATADETKASEVGVKAIYQMTHVTKDSLNELTKLIESGVVIPRIGKEFPLDEIIEAFEARESGNVSGKIVVNIKS